jgi:hypothetical protein
LRRVFQNRQEGYRITTNTHCNRNHYTQTPNESNTILPLFAIPLSPVMLPASKLTQTHEPLARSMPLNSAEKGSALRSTLITVAIVVFALAFAATLLPRGFSDDLSRIGQGRPAVVLIHDKEAVASMELMTMLNDIRSDYEDRLEFLAIDVVTEDGRRFAQSQGLGSSLLVLFDGTGNRVGIVDGIRDPAVLRSTLERQLGLPPS